MWRGMISSSAKAFLPILAIAFVAVALSVKFGTHGGEGLCGGRAYPVVTVSGGASPFIKLSADGVSGAFLLDYGATKSLLSASAFPSSTGPIEVGNFSLPGFSKGSFAPVRFDNLSLKPPGGQFGVVGTDFLSLLTAQFSKDEVFLGGEPCQPSELFAHGLTPISESGFFSSDFAKVDRGRPNVPVAFVSLGDVHAFAQIDTGYDDVLYLHTVDINKPLFDRLVAEGASLERIKDITVATCSGSETRTVYKPKNLPLVIETERGTPIRRMENFYLMTKSAKGCGGIAAMTVPAAQLGASFLQAFGTVIFDPRSEIVWLKADAKVAQAAP